MGGSERGVESQAAVPIDGSGSTLCTQMADSSLERSHKEVGGGAASPRTQCKLRGGVQMWDVAS